MATDAEAYGRSVTIAVVNMFAGKHKVYRELTMPINRAYCAAHGYDYVDLDPAEAQAHVRQHAPAWAQEDRPVHFLKFAGLAAVLERTQADWALWQDADALFFNHNFRLADLVDPRYELIVPALLHNNKSHWHGVYNTGNVLVRNSPRALDILRRAYNIGMQRRYITSFYDQGALMELSAQDKDVRAQIKLVQHRAMNSQPEVDYSWHDFVIHFPGPKWQYKRPLMEDFAAHLLPLGKDSQPRYALPTTVYASP